MRIGVTGAFGFLGANFVAALLDRRPRVGEVVTFFSRARENPLFDAALTTPVALDVRDPDRVRDATRGLDILVHFAGSVNYARARKREVWDVNVLGARNVFEAVLVNGIGRLLYVSSINVLGAPVAPTDLADESNDVYHPGAGNPNALRSTADALAAARDSLAGDYGFLDRVRVAYFDSKLAACELAREYHRSRGLPVVTILPGTAVGAGDLHYDISQLVDRVFAGRLGATFSGGTSFVAATDVARGALLAMERGRTGEQYIISGRDEDNLSYRRFMQRVAGVARAAGRRIRTDFAVIPEWAALPVAAAAEALNPSSSLTAALARSGAVTHRFTSRKAAAELGYSPSRSLEQGIADCYEFLAALGTPGA
jgi:dihydroflavonol-4-reductase